MSSFLGHKIVRTAKKTETILSKSTLPRALLLSRTFDRHARDFTHGLDASCRWILCQPGWKFLNTPIAKYTSEGARACGLASGNLSHTGQEFSRTRPPRPSLVHASARQERRKWRGCQNWRGCQFWRVPVPEGASSAEGASSGAR